MEHALVLRGKCVRANMRWNLGQTVPARTGDPTADKIPGSQGRVNESTAPSHGRNLRSQSNGTDSSKRVLRGPRALADRAFGLQTPADPNFRQRCVTGTTSSEHDERALKKPKRSFSNSLKRTPD
jgi:hypothetical protein